MRGEPNGDRVAGALVVRLVGKIMLLAQIMIEQNGLILTLIEPRHSLAHVARHIQLITSQPRPKPFAARFVVFD